MPSNLCQWALAAMLLIGIPAAMAADNYDRAAAEARKASGGKVIKCSPDGAAGTVSVAEAIRVLKPGDVLQLYPGVYESMPTIATSKVIIEGGVPGGYCNLQLYLSGQEGGYVVRNLWFNGLLLDGGALVVDSTFNSITTGFGPPRTEYVLYNCCCRSIAMDSPKATLAVVDSTLYQNASSCFAIATTGDILIKLIDSIVYAKHIAIRTKGRAKLELGNSLVYGESGLAKDASFDTKKQGVIPLDLASLQKFTKCRIEGENLFEKPLFKRQTSWPNERTIGFNDQAGRSNYCLQIEGEAPDFFLLADESPAKARGMGAHLDEKGFPVPQVVKTRPPGTPAKR